jgi:hypothetical protein
MSYYIVAEPFDGRDADLPCIPAVVTALRASNLATATRISAFIKRRARCAITEVLPAEGVPATVIIFIGFPFKKFITACVMEKSQGNRPR